VSLISNTGPLVALAKVDSLLLLQELFGEVWIPPAVHRELLAKGGPEAQRLDDAFQAYVHVSETPPIPPDVEQVTHNLGAGEQQAIALARHYGALLLIDDRSGRNAARHLGVKVTGTAGVLVQAKCAGRIPRVRPLLEEMRQAGYYLSDALIEVALRLANEAEP
jgi:predicted nucleic acid-binding protein